MARRKLRGARVVLTGASSGIGWALAHRLARDHARLIVTARRRDRLEELARQLAATGAEIHLVAGDITRSTIRDELTQLALQRWGALDLLINNAGVGAVGPFAQADPERLRQIMEVNFFAPAELTRQAFFLLRQGNRPMLVNVGSVLGYCAVPSKSEYCASKFALHGWSDALALEWKRAGIDVLLVSPNTTRSEFFEHLLSRQREVAVNPLSMSADQVAEKIATAICRGRAERILTLSGSALVWLDRLCPWLLRPILRRWG